MVSALQRRVRALEADLATARSEVSIVRSNATKADKQHAADLARVQKQNAEELAKHERIAEAAAAASKHANTELEFLQRDMREVNDRSRKRGTNLTTAGPGTPKKAKSWGLNDGIDDIHIVASPNKTQGRTKSAGSVAVNVGERTPSKGKRKRPTADSPAMALDTHSDDVLMLDAVQTSTPMPPSVMVAAPSLPFDVSAAMPVDLLVLICAVSTAGPRPRSIPSATTHL
jgi:hypothetical protein